MTDPLRSGPAEAGLRELLRRCDNALYEAGYTPDSKLRAELHRTMDALRSAPSPEADAGLRELRLLRNWCNEMASKINEIIDAINRGRG